MIDTTLFGVDLPAGTYTTGDVVELGVIAGPANVRSGRGAAFLKMINSGILLGASGAGSFWKISVVNSDWIDPCENIAGKLTDNTSLDVRSGCNNFGHNCPLTPNSSWKVIATAIDTKTTTVANSLYTLIDVDYPEVASIVNPETLTGFPTAIEHNISGYLNGAGTLTTAAWDRKSVDYMKAGYEYALDKVESFTSAGGVGFLQISNAAGMGGLSRIIPITLAIEGIKQTIDYASKIRKGPMDISVMMFAASGTAGAANISFILDYVKRRV